MRGVLVDAPILQNSANRLPFFEKTIAYGLLNCVRLYRVLLKNGNNIKKHTENI